MLREIAVKIACGDRQSNGAVVQREMEEVDPNSNESQGGATDLLEVLHCFISCRNGTIYMTTDS